MRVQKMRPIAIQTRQPPFHGVRSSPGAAEVAYAEKLRDSAKRVAAKYVRDHDAEEVASEVFLALTALPEDQDPKGREGRAAWVCRRATFWALDKVRRESTRKKCESRTVPPDAFKDVARQWLERLPQVCGEDAFQIVRQRIEGVSFAKIAEREAKSVSHVSKVFYAAIDQMRELIEHDPIQKTPPKGKC